MSLETSRAGTAINAGLTELEAEERYACERYQLYKAKAYGSRPTSLGRLRELERRSSWRRGGWMRLCGSTPRSRTNGELEAKTKVHLPVGLPTIKEKKTWRTRSQTTN
jgi:hypothetical protein